MHHFLSGLREKGMKPLNSVSGSTKLFKWFEDDARDYLSAAVACSEEQRHLLTVLLEIVLPQVGRPRPTLRLPHGERMRN